MHDPKTHQQLFLSMPPPCKFYATGNCKKGNKCNFSHGDLNSGGFGSSGFGKAGFLNSNGFLNTNGFSKGFGGAFGLNTPQNPSNLLLDFTNTSTVSQKASVIKTDLDEYSRFHALPSLSAFGLGYPAVNNLISGRDVSPEELRIQYIEAVASNSVPQYENMLRAREKDMKFCVNHIKGKEDLAARYLMRSAEPGTNLPKPFIPKSVDENVEQFMKEPSSNGGFGASNFSSAGAFGSQNSAANPFASNNAFGGSFQPAATSAFGSTSTGSSFGNATNNSAAGNSTFGSAKPASGLPFGSSGFGNNSSNLGFGSSGFGNAPTSSGFGSSAPASGFGSTTGTTSGFGSSGFGSLQASTGGTAFGSTGFGSSGTSPASSAFGSSGFGSSGFGAQPAASGFGASGFGAAKPVASPFGAAAATTTTNTASPFGAPQNTLQNPFAANTAPTSSGISPFGQTAANSTPGSSASAAISQTPASNPFGASNLSPFGQVDAKSGPGGSGFGTFSTQQTAFGASNTANGFVKQTPPASGGFGAQNTANAPEDNLLGEYDPAVAAAFTSSVFTLGNVPDIAPPAAVC